MLDNIFYMNLSQGSSPCCEGDWLAERRKALVWDLGTGVAGVESWFVLANT